MNKIGILKIIIERERERLKILKRRFRNELIFSLKVLCSSFCYEFYRSFKFSFREHVC